MKKLLGFFLAVFILVSPALAAGVYTLSGAVKRRFGRAAKK